MTKSSKITLFQGDFATRFYFTNLKNSFTVSSYANYSHNTVIRNTQIHNPTPPLLFGDVGPDEVIKERKIKSCKECQMTLFDL